MLCILFDQKRSLFPENATGFISFCRTLAKRKQCELVRLSNLLNSFFTYLPHGFLFLHRFLNSIIDNPIRQNASALVMIIPYVLISLLSIS